MNANYTSPTTYPMPDTRCPVWCERDHLADWQQHVAVGLDTRQIPAAGVGVLPDTRRPLSDWLDLFEPFHVCTLATVDLDDRGEVAEVDLQRGVRNDATLYLDAQGSMTAEQARWLASELLNAADRLDEVTGGQ